MNNRPIRTLSGWIAASLLLGAGCADSHEFWMRPDRFNAAPGARVGVSLFVGQDFSGEQVAISRQLVSAFRDLSAKGTIDLTPIVAAGTVGHISVPLASAGTHVLALDSHPSAIELPAGKFNEYLELEGLQRIIRARELAGTTSAPGRERYRRNIKALLQAGPGSDDTFRRSTGQRLEIVPITDPRVFAPRTPSGFSVVFDAQPLADALVKFWQRDGTQLVAFSERTDVRGRVSVQLPAAGVWMASVVHMIPAEGAPEFDWDSYWGNLTFEARSQSAEVPAKRSAQRRAGTRARPSP